MDSIAFIITSASSRPRPQPAEVGDSPAAARMRAVLALESVDALIAASEAAKRSGSWKPGAASSPADYGLLADAQEILARPRHY